MTTATTKFAWSVAAAATAAGFLILGPLGTDSAHPRTPTHPQTSTVKTGGYVFSDIHITGEPDPVTDVDIPGHARINYRVAWAGEAFPGTRECTWVVRDETGNEIGSTTRILTSVSSSATDRVYTDVDVSGDPASADVSCGDSRTDDASGRFEFSNPSVAARSANPGRDFDVSFVADWAGAGSPTPQSCTVRARAADGTPVAERTTNLIVMQTDPTVTTFWMDQGPGHSARPASASISCRPIG